MRTDPAPRLSFASFDQLAPAVVASLRALTQAIDASGLDKALTELLKVRVSQRNGCLFCLQFHLNLARKHGVDQARLDQVAVWRESALFSPRERAALGWSEALDAMGLQPVDDAAWQALQAHFDPGEIAHLTAAVAAIEAWNRIAGSLRFAPPTPA